MKKYIQPNIKVTTVASEIICTSDPVGVNNSYGYEGTDQLSKERNGDFDVYEW